MALLRFFSMAGELSEDTSLLTYRDTLGTVVLTQQRFRQRMQAVLRKLGLSSADYGTHSLWRDGATWLMMCSVSMETIMAVGDRKSD